MKMCVLPRYEALQAQEDSLVTHALVALVVGTRPRCSIHRAKRFIVDNYNISPEDFSVRRYQPEDFLIIFNDNAALETILHAPPLPRAEANSMHFRVLVELRCMVGCSGVGGAR